MSQRDMVLKLPLCNLDFIRTGCDCPATQTLTMVLGAFNEYLVVEDEQGARFQHLCEVAVPGSCPRVQCFSETSDKYLPCRMQILIQNQRDGDDFWMKLPCSQCPEERKLHSTTEVFVYGEDTGGD
jgi:hypothetical protein